MVKSKGQKIEVTPQLKKKIREDDPARFNERTPLNGSVTRPKIATNAVGTGELSGSTTDNTLRAVDSTHQKDNSTTGRILSGSTTDNTPRAVDSPHIRTDAIIKRTMPFNVIDSDLLSGSATDDALRAVQGTNIKNGTITSRTIGSNQVTSAELAGSATDNALRAVAGTHLKDGLMAARHFSARAVHGANIQLESLGWDLMGASTKNQAQSTPSMRTIGTLLGGDSSWAASANHSHSAGNALNIDRLPDEDRKRILAYRRQVLDDLSAVQGMTSAQLRTFVYNLAVVASAAFAFTSDAPDIDADERQTKREAGEEVLPGWEYRQSKAREGLPEEPTDGMDGTLFKGQKHYDGGAPPRSIRPGVPNLPTPARGAV